MHSNSELETNNANVTVGDENSWHLWNDYQVIQWIQMLLIKRHKSGQRIDQFISGFSKHDIDGQLLLRFRNDQEKLKDFQNIFPDKSFGIWTMIEDALHDLPPPGKSDVESHL